jgi:hypothetical protein
LRRVLADSGCVAATPDCGATDEGAAELAGALDVSAVPDEDVLAAGDWTLTEATPLEQPAASAASKPPPSRTLIRLPTTDPRSIDTEVDIPATQAQHYALCRGRNGGTDSVRPLRDQLFLFPNIPLRDGGTGGQQALRAFHSGWPAGLLPGHCPRPVVAVGLDADDNQDDN